MFSKELLKEIISTNESFILNEVRDIVKREGINFTETLHKVNVLWGVRRSGKTFILYDFFKEHEGECLYVDFEDERLIDFRVGDLELLKEAFLELNPQLINKRKTFLFDEIQNIKGWEKFCRRQAEKENTNVMVTGSSSAIMPLEIHTSLRGRAWAQEVMPFSFREYLKAKDIVINNELIYGPKRAIVKNYFKDYLEWGGFPEVVFAKNDFEKTKIIKEYLGSIFFKDLVERFRINNISLLDILLETLFSSCSQKFSLTSFYKQYKDKLPFSKDSLFNYYKYFLQSMIIFETKKFAESAYKRMRNPAKVYLVDMGLAKRVSSQDKGKLLENAVFLELRKRTEKIFYFEEEKECDFVINENGRLFAYQVSYELSSNNRERELSGLALCCKRLNLREGLVLTFDQEEEFVKEGIRIKITPSWKFSLIH